MRLSHGEGIFNDRLLFESNRLMFSLLFVFWNFLWEDNALMEGDKVVMGDPLSPPTRENPGLYSSQNIRTFHVIYFCSWNSRGILYFELWGMMS